MLKKLDGLVGVITGAGTGIGAAIARDLGSAGIRLVLVGRRMEPLAECAAQVRASEGDAVAVSGDVRDYADIDRGVRTALERWDRLDVLVPNAAVADFGPIA
jgi:NADP-dependent 3-hydroxy acid dehydrogenase YdfG